MKNLSTRELCSILKDPLPHDAARPDRERWMAAAEELRARTNANLAPRALTQTYTYVILELSKSAYDEIHEKLDAAGYEHAFSECDGRPVISMQGIAVSAEPPGPPVTALDERRAIVKWCRTHLKLNRNAQLFADDLERGVHLEEVEHLG